jgi:hypothetical protein
MSADKSTSSDSTISPEKPSPRKITSDPHGLANVDWRIQHLKNHLSPVPYILNTPSDKPYTLRTDDWRLTWNNGHPFDNKEESLQYLSFLHIEWQDTLIHPIGGWDDGKGRIMQEDPTKVEDQKSVPGTPLMTTSGAKKKIAFNDYLGRKGKPDLSNIPSQQPPTGEIETKTNMEEKVVGAKVNGEPDKGKKEEVSIRVSHEPPRRNGKDEKSVASRTAGKKRPLEDPEDPIHNHSATPHDSSRPEKKPRLSSPIHDAPRKSSPIPDATNIDLPREISPSLPPSLSDNLPGSISPTLPPSIEKELKKATITNGVVGHKKTDSVTSLISEGKDSKPISSPKPKSNPPQVTNGTKDAVKATPSPSIQASKAGKGYKPSDSDVSQKSVLLNGLKASTLNENARVKEPKTEKKRRIVRLKYGRKNRTAIDRILRMTKKVSHAPARKPREEEPRSQKEKLSKVDEGSTKSPLPRPEKRTRPADEEESATQPQKRQKVPSSLSLHDKPKTPVPPSFKSPAFSKSQFSTPKKDLKSVAMRRVDSGDGDARTPSGPRSGTPTAPSSVERGTIAKSSPPNTSGNLDSKQEQKRLWRVEAGKYDQLARSLKHQADNHLKAKEGPTAHITEEDAKLGAVTALETTLCYMLSFFATDQATLLSTGKHVTDASSWQSIISYWYFVRERVEAFSDLHGLCLQIGALCREIIHTIDMEKFAQDPLPKHSGDGHSPPADLGHMTPNSTKAAQYLRDYLEFKNKMVLNYNKARALWVDGMRDLSLQKIKEEYPKTWAMQETDVSGKGKEKFVPGKYEGPFFLPLCGTSNPIEAVRFGCGLLGEWSKKEGIKWDAKIGL